LGEQSALFGVNEDLAYAIENGNIGDLRVGPKSLSCLVYPLR